jgi:hypothetical protein
MNAGAGANCVERSTTAIGLIVIETCSAPGSSANRKCALSSALFRRVEVPLALK